MLGKNLKNPHSWQAGNCYFRSNVSDNYTQSNPNGICGVQNSPAEAFFRVLLFSHQYHPTNCSYSYFIHQLTASFWIKQKFSYSVHSYGQYFFLLWRCDPTRVMAFSFLMFLDHIQRRTTVGRTPLDEWSARRRDLYLTTYNTHNRQTSMSPVGFEPTISAGE